MGNRTATLKKSSIMPRMEGNWNAGMHPVALGEEIFMVLQFPFHKCRYYHHNVYFFPSGLSHKEPDSGSIRQPVSFSILAFGSFSAIALGLHEFIVIINKVYYLL